MFLKSLLITAGHKVIREITFRKGINLIVDETPNISDINSGNDVGKTTVLKLIDFCFGAKPQIIYTHPENKKENYELVKDFLIKNEVLITLTLTDDLENEDANEIVIERNFLARSKTVRRINGQIIKDEDFEYELLKLIFPDHYSEKPTLRQLTSHNIRYKDEHLNNTLYTLGSWGKDVDYEALYLFLLNCNFESGNEKQEIFAKLQQEITFKSRLEKRQNKTAYETTLALINNEIDILNNRKSFLNINENFEADLDKLKNIKYQINRTSSEISQLKIRKDLIIETQQELSTTISNIELQQLQIIYQQATTHVKSIQKTFDDLVNYHNQMVNEKIKFITKELPLLEKRIQERNSQLKELLKQEKKISEIISKSSSFEELEQLIGELNTKYQQKGEFENIVQQISDVESNIATFNKDLKEIEEQLFSGDFEQVVKRKKNKFNTFFASISNQLYGEQYALNYDITTHQKTKQKIYKFSTFSPFTPNMSSGKKQGEIASFDIAYILFADNENIPCLHFLLNDKKELMDDNQLKKIANLANENNIQFVASILKDKLPLELCQDEYYILKLSQTEKLFKIEN